MQVTRTDSHLLVESPFHPDLPKRAKENGGIWDNETRVWKYDLRDELRVSALYLSIYGLWDSDQNSPIDLVTVKITAISDISSVCGGIYFAGRLIAGAKDRDSGARLGKGVVLIGGRATSGGSRNNWKTIIEADACFEVKDIPYSLCEAERREGDWDIEIVTYPEREALLRERDRLIARVSEIDEILSAPGEPKQ
ncbi:MAG: hypothetical protein KQH59_06620 [Desulfobulbaceae bacterium]|nr:hypothetical protein [Desulfobulbaceae bacterium]